MAIIVASAQALSVSYASTGEEVGVGDGVGVSVASGVGVTVGGMGVLVGDGVAVDVGVNMGVWVGGVVCVSAQSGSLSLRNVISVGSVSARWLLPTSR